MKGFAGVLVTLCGLLAALLSTTVGADYIAAVAEHTTFTGSSSSDTPSYLLSKNLDIYEGLTSLAASKKVQILVFPEFGLTPYDASARPSLYPFAEVIPDTAVVPCNNTDFSDRPILSRMSCAAKNNNIALLINTVDYVACSLASDPNCPSDDHYQYNTDVVFNEQGNPNS
jgi:predicted amidohydrolase